MADFTATSSGSSTNPTPPGLAMLLDRTSFDETDNYGVDPAVLDVAPWTREELGQDSPEGQTRIMKNGRVRRRLRWRPKNLKKRAPRPQSMSSPEIEQRDDTTSGISSGASVASASSRGSKKSIHSLASIETMVQDNTEKNRITRRFVTLPRPYYPNTFGGVATIGTEGDMVYTRINTRGRGRTPTLSTVEDAIAFETFNPMECSAYTLQDDVDERVEEEKDDIEKPCDTDCVHTEIPTYEMEGQELSSTKTPVFSDDASRQTEESSDEDSWKSSKLLTSVSHEKDRSEMKTMRGVSMDLRKPAIDESSTVSLPVAPLPCLSCDLVERDHRVDLRIRSPMNYRRHTSTNAGNGIRSTIEMKTVLSMPARLGDDSDTVSVDELRAPSRQHKHRSSKYLIQAARKERCQPGQNVTTELRSESFVIPESLRNGGASAPEVDGDPESAEKRTHQQSSPTDSRSMHEDEIRFSMSELPKYAASEGGRDNTIKECERQDQQFASLVNAWSENSAQTGNLSLDVEKNLQAIHQMATEHLEQGEYDEALDVFQEILRGQLARYGENHFRVGTAHHNIGIVYMKRGDHANAIKSYREAVRVRKKALDENHADVAVSLAQLGVAFLESRKHRKAIGAFREALKIRRHCYGNTHPKVAKILNNIGCALNELNELEVALVAFEEALSIQRQLLRDSPVESGNISENSLLGIASTQCNIASIKLYCGAFDEATIDLEEALLIQQCVMGDNHPSVRRTQESLAWLEKARGKASVYRAADFFGKRSLDSGLSEGREGILTYSGSDSQHSSRTKEITVFDTFERKLMSINANLGFGCGVDTYADEFSVASSKSF